MKLTEEQANLMIEIIKALRDEKEIQVRDLRKDQWHCCERRLDWILDWITRNKYGFRVKPESVKELERKEIEE